MSKTVLVCDDEPYILESVSYVIREEGYSVLMADNGDDALRLARSESPDAMILDISMPRKDGNLVCKELKAGPATRGIYIIVLTARGQERDMQESYCSGADEFMTKPFSPRNLRKRLHELLDERT
jgi:two-component system, OmpR family, alkaline phosphatase synthesis response regulator PhoP